MKTVILKVNNATQTITEHEIVVDDGQPTVIDAMPNVNYELVDFDTGHAPTSILTRRQADDLYITMDNSGRQTDLIIVGYYNSVGNEVIGAAQEGSYYHYVPVNEQVDSFITALDESESKTQMLGGEGQTSPWWIGASDIAVLTDRMLANDAETVTTSSQAIDQPTEMTIPAAIPWLVAITLLGVVVSNSSNDDDPIKDDTDETAVNDVIVIDDSTPITPSISADSTITTIIPNGSTSILTASYIDATDTTLEIPLTKDANTDQWAAVESLPIGVMVDEVSGKVTLAMSQTDTMSSINVIAKNTVGESMQATLLEEGSNTIAINELDTSFIDGGLGVDIPNITMGDVIATSSDILNVYGFEVINLVGDNNYVNLDSTSFTAGNDSKTFVNSTGNNNLVDLANNSDKSNDENNVDLENWSQSETDVTTLDTQGETPIYNIYTNGADVLYIQTEITVI